MMATEHRTLARRLGSSQAVSQRVIDFKQKNPHSREAEPRV